MKHEEEKIKVICWFCHSEVTEEDKGLCRRCEKKTFYGPSKAWLEREKSLRLAAESVYYH